MLKRQIGVTDNVRNTGEYEESRRAQIECKRYLTS